MLKLFEQLAEQSGQSKAELLRGLIEDVVDPNGPAPVRRDVVTRKTQVIFFSKLFITALEEALDYDPQRHHNQPPPLRLDDEDYLAEIKTLIAELKRLNENLGHWRMTPTVPDFIGFQGQPHKIYDGEPCALPKEPAAEDRLRAHGRHVIAAFRSTHCHC